MVHPIQQEQEPIISEMILLSVIMAFKYDGFLLLLYRMRIQHTAI